MNFIEKGRRGSAAVGEKGENRLIRIQQKNPREFSVGVVPFGQSFVSFDQIVRQTLPLREVGPDHQKMFLDKFPHRRITQHFAIEPDAGGAPVGTGEYQKDRSVLLNRLTEHHRFVNVLLSVNGRNEEQQQKE